jgi:type III pantothenate kinase
VNAGTIVTIDALDGQGVFAGGIIVPGPQLMLHAVTERAPALKVPPGRIPRVPATANDALATGAIEAVCGAIELMRARLAPRRGGRALLPDRRRGASDRTPPLGSARGRG